MKRIINLSPPKISSNTDQSSIGTDRKMRLRRGDLNQILEYGQGRPAFGLNGGPVRLAGPNSA